MYGKVVTSFHHVMSCGLCADEFRRRSDGSGQYTPLSRQDSSDSHHHGRLSAAAVGRLGVAIERRDSTSSMESRSSVSERSGSKHSRKPQQVFSSKKLGEESRGVGGDSLSISVDWGALPSNMTLSNGGGGFSHVTTPPVEDVTMGGDETTPSTVVSLPLLYSARADSGENVPQVPPYSSSNQQSADLAPQKPASSSPGEFPGNPAGSQRVKTHLVPLETLKPVLTATGGGSGSTETTPLKRERGVTSGSGWGMPASAVRGTCLSVIAAVENLSTLCFFHFSPSSQYGRFVSGKYKHLVKIMICICVSFQPLKKRQRPVLKSSVVQMRQKCHSPLVPSPAHLSSFLTSSGNYRSKRHLHPTSPKVCAAVHAHYAQWSVKLKSLQVVYPPLYPAMYKLFSEQESERVKLVTSHLTEQV